MKDCKRAALITGCIEFQTNDDGKLKQVLRLLRLGVQIQQYMPLLQLNATKSDLYTSKKSLARRLLPTNCFTSEVL